jgi:D-alanyl-D-alanine carboxypeptidase/D-alanyl-D-alanine-endopeptidase (penicillin-binding protein 4)
VQTAAAPLHDTSSTNSVAGSESPVPTASEVPDSKQAQELRNELDRIIDESKLARARWGIYIASLKDGRVLYSRNGSGTFTPASNMKIYTTAISLDLLGPDYRWRTSVFAPAEPDANGTIQGDLTLYGRGAPDLSSSEIKGTSSHFSQLADELYRKGLRRVAGDLVADASYFKGEELGDGWLWNDVQWYYGAEPSALTVNGNEVQVTVSPAEKVGEPAIARLNYGADYFPLVNETRTALRFSQMTVGVKRALSGNQIRVWGDFPVSGSTLTARIAAHEPAVMAGLLFGNALRERGVTIEGKIRTRDYRSGNDGVERDKQIELASVESATLGEVVRDTNKESINLNAELLLRTLGKERGYTAPDANVRKMAIRGDDEAGAAVEHKWLQDHHISTDWVSLHDGSGLSRLDIVTPEVTAQLLMAISASQWGDLFRKSLPEAGRDGTLRGRMAEIGEGRVYAKTGTLTAVNSLSGYALTADGQGLVFSIFCNDETAPNGATPVIDSIIRRLTTSRLGS